jgi:AcrR family transcriptional regulator
MAKKAPRRTAERILETTLVLFNRFGAPNVTTAQISAELGISPGNLYYHYPAKDELVNALFERYRLAIDTLLEAGPEVRDVEDAWFFLHSVFELIWQYRFLYRDLNDLLSNSLLLETHFKTILADKTTAVRGLLAGMEDAGVLRIAEAEAEATATGMVVLLTYWLSFEYVRDPRRALEPEAGQQAALRGAHHVLNLLAPYLADGSRAHLLTLVAAYGPAGDTQRN